jgi:hypothetical protein
LDWTTGTLYVNAQGFGSGGQELVAIDIVTGAETGRVSLPTFIGGGGQFDPNTGSLIGIAPVAEDGTNQLMVVDPMTGATEYRGDGVLFPSYSSNTLDWTTGTLYVNAQGFGSGGQELVAIDIVTGAETGRVSLPTFIGGGGHFACFEPTAQQLLTDLLESIDELRLPNGVEHPLLAALQQVFAALDRANTQAACQHLGRAQRIVQTRLAPPESTALLSEMAELGTSIGCN